MLYEECYFTLHCELRAEKYHITLECDGIATMLWRGLSRMSQNAEARNFLVIEGCEERFRWHFPDDKIAELEEALMK